MERSGAGNHIKPAGRGGEPSLKRCRSTFFLEESHSRSTFEGLRVKSPSQCGDPYVRKGGPVDVSARKRQESHHSDAEYLPRKVVKIEHSTRAANSVGKTALQQDSQVNRSNPLISVNDHRNIEVINPASQNIYLQLIGRLQRCKTENAVTDILTDQSCLDEINSLGHSCAIDLIKQLFVEMGDGVAKAAAQCDGIINLIDKFKHEFDEELWSEIQKICEYGYAEIYTDKGLLVKATTDLKDKEKEKNLILTARECVVCSELHQTPLQCANVGKCSSLCGHCYNEILGKSNDRKCPGCNFSFKGEALEDMKMMPELYSLANQLLYTICKYCRKKRDLCDYDQHIEHEHKEAFPEVPSAVRDHIDLFSRMKKNDETAAGENPKANATEVVSVLWRDELINKAIGKIMGELGDSKKRKLLTLLGVQDEDCINLCLSKNSENRAVIFKHMKKNYTPFFFIQEKLEELCPSSSHYSSYKKFRKRYSLSSYKFDSLYSEVDGNHKLIKTLAQINEVCTDDNLTHLLSCFEISKEDVSTLKSGGGYNIIGFLECFVRTHIYFSLVDLSLLIDNIPNAHALHNVLAKEVDVSVDSTLSKAVDDMRAAFEGNEILRAQLPVICDQHLSASHKQLLILHTVKYRFAHSGICSQNLHALFELAAERGIPKDELLSSLIHIMPKEKVSALFGAINHA